MDGGVSYHHTIQRHVPVLYTLKKMLNFDFFSIILTDKSIFFIIFSLYFIENFSILTLFGNSKSRVNFFYIQRIEHQAKVSINITIF